MPRGGGRMDNPQQQVRFQSAASGADNNAASGAGSAVMVDDVVASSSPMMSWQPLPRRHRGGRSWVDVAMREAVHAQQAPMARILIMLVERDVYSCLAVWLFGEKRDLVQVGPALCHVKNCCRLVTVAFHSATLCRRVLQQAPPSASRRSVASCRRRLRVHHEAPRSWCGAPRFRLEESLVVWSRLISYPKGAEGAPTTVYSLGSCDAIVPPQEGLEEEQQAQ